MKTQKYNNITKKLDKFITKSKLAIPLFLVLLFLVFEITFSFWNFIAWYLDQFFNYLYSLIWIKNTFSDAVFGGFLGLAIYFPNIVILYFFLFLLKDSWVLPRISFVFDKMLKKVWLSWNWFLSMFMWFGCTVPAILSTSEIENKKEKILTIMMLPFISCSAKLPVFVLFIWIFIAPKYQSIALFWTYLFWILLGIISSFILSRILKHRKQKFNINLPNYRIPEFKKIIFQVLKMLKWFFVKVWKYVIPLSIIFTLAFSYPNSNDIKNTYWAKIWKTISVIFKPLWFNQEMSISAISWLVAKEVTVSTLGSLYYISDWDTKWLINKVKNDKTVTFASAISFLLFILLYTPCIGSIVAARAELWKKWWTIFFLYPLILAWIISFIFYNIFIILF